MSVLRSVAVRTLNAVYVFVAVLQLYICSMNSPRVSVASGEIHAVLKHGSGSGHEAQHWS